MQIIHDPIYAISTQEGPRTVVGSFKKSSNENYIQQLETGQRYPHRLPPSKVGWTPGTESTTFASTSTSLRVWKVGDEKPVVKLYASNKSTSINSHASPMTSFDWNRHVLHKAATCSLDTTIAVWDVERGKLETQLIAHDKAVFDITYTSSNQFCSVSQDGSLRQFDSRDLDHSTILYEDALPLLRVAARGFFIAVTVHENSDILLFDTRKPGFLCSVLRCNGICPNAIAWNEESQNGILSAGLADGTCALFINPADSVKMKPSKLLETPQGYTEGGIANISWAGNQTLSTVHGNSVVHRRIN